MWWIALVPPGQSCLKLDGSTNGAGVLVVKSGKLQMRATSNWVGLIIMVGENVSFKTGGGGPGNLVYGSVLIGENTPLQPK